MGRIQIALAGFSMPWPIAERPRQAAIEEALRAPLPFELAQQPLMRHHQRYECAQRNEDPEDREAAGTRAPRREDRTRDPGERGIAQLGVASVQARNLFFTAGAKLHVDGGGII